MTGSGFSLGRILGFPVWVSWSAVFILALVVLQGRSDDPADLAMGLVYGLGLFGSILVHELGHAVVGRRLGLGPSDILLHGFGGLTRYARAPGPRQGIYTSAAGPLAGLTLGAGSLVVMLALGDRLPAGVGEAFGWLISINIFWSLFNLLPMVPLDGGHLLLHVLGLKLRPEKALSIVRVVSVMVALVVGVAAWTQMGSIIIPLFCGMIVMQNLRLH